MKSGQKLAYIKDKLLAIFLIFIAFTAPLIISPIIKFWIPPISDFSVDGNFTQFRAGYPIPFKWEFVGSPEEV